MKVYESKDIRNVALIGHGNSGKTSIAAGILYTTGATDGMTRVDEGDAVTDFDDDEIARKVTISTAAASADGRDQRSTCWIRPDSIFSSTTRMRRSFSRRSAGGVDAVAGVEVQTEKVWEFANEFSQPRAIIVNKLDRERASFERAIESINENFGRAAVPVQLPIGAERDFNGVVDLVRMKAYTYTADGDGKGKEGEIPAALADAARKAHDALVEMVAEGNDALMEEFFEQGALSPEHMLEGVRSAVLERRLFPVLCASGLHNIGTDLILNFVAENFPAPDERGTVKAKSGDQEVERKVSDSEPVSAYVFKTLADPFSGRVSYFKVYSGVLKNDASLTNTRTNGAERLAHIGCPMGKSPLPITELHAGDIGVVAKLKETTTGDTLGDKGSLVEYPPVKIPEPSIAYAIDANPGRTKTAWATRSTRSEEHQALRFYRDPPTTKLLLTGSGRQHVEVIVSRLGSATTGVDAQAPQDPLSRNHPRQRDVQGRHEKQTGSHGQFGDCWIRSSPSPAAESPSSRMRSSALDPQELRPRH